MNRKTRKMKWIGNCICIATLYNCKTIGIRCSRCSQFSLNNAYAKIKVKVVWNVECRHENLLTTGHCAVAVAHYYHKTCQAAAFIKTDLKIN